jgi:hypothetical protein
VTDRRRKLNVNACNLEEMRGVIRDIEANFAVLFEALANLQRPAEQSEARPT